MCIWVFFTVLLQEEGCGFESTYSGFEASLTPIVYAGKFNPSAMTDSWKNDELVLSSWELIQYKATILPV